MNPTSYVNIFYLGRLWRDINLTKLTGIIYPAGRSAYNPIEHTWSPLSNRLTTVILPATLDGEDLPPCKQSSYEGRINGEICKNARFSCGTSCF